jgi:hypothetical protein
MSTEEYCLLSRVLVLRDHGVEPDGILAVEDSTSGIRSAVAAGMRVLGVGAGPSAEQLAPRGPLGRLVGRPGTDHVGTAVVRCGQCGGNGMRVALVAQDGKKEAMRAWALQTRCAPAQASPRVRREPLGA